MRGGGGTFSFPSQKNVASYDFSLWESGVLFSVCYKRPPHTHTHTHTYTHTHTLCCSTLPRSRVWQASFVVRAAEWHKELPSPHPHGQAVVLALGPELRTRVPPLPGQVGLHSFLIQPLTHRNHYHVHCNGILKCVCVCVF